MWPFVCLNDDSSQAGAEFSTQASSAYVLPSPQPSLTLIHVYVHYKCWQSALPLIALAVKIHCYLHNHKIQSSNRSRRACQKAFICRQANLSICHKNDIFRAKKVSPMTLQPTVIPGSCTKLAKYK